MDSKNIKEGIEFGDLARLVNPVLSIDEYRSKMGEDKDIVVLGLTVFGKDPAEDLVNFAEKSYDWVLDADISSGETSDGNYIAFIELQRGPKVINQILTLVTDMLNLTKQKREDWTFTYYRGDEEFPMDKENLTKKIVTDSEEYESKTDEHLRENTLNDMRALAGVKVKPQVVTDLQILDLQIAAGIK